MEGLQLRSFLVKQRLNLEREHELKVKITVPVPRRVKSRIGPSTTSRKVGVPVTDEWDEVTSVPLPELIRRDIGTPLPNKNLFN